MHTKQGPSPGCDPKIAKWPKVDNPYLCTSVSLTVKSGILLSLSLSWIYSLSHLSALLLPFSFLLQLLSPSLVYSLRTEAPIFLLMWTTASSSNGSHCHHFFQGLFHIYMASRISILKPNSDDGSLTPAEFSSQSGLTLSGMALEWLSLLSSRNT